jgi:hypothetical protein
MGDENSYKILIRKPERKKPIGRPRCRWDDSIKIDHKEIVCEDVNWILLTVIYGPILGSCRNLPGTAN